MKHHYFFILFSLFGLSVFGQQSSIEGNIADTINYRPMAYSSVALIRKSDSLLIAHQWSTAQSSFFLRNIPAGNYMLRISRPSFADYEEEIQLLENEAKNMGNIVLFSKANLLRDVIIKERRNAITIKGDTTEFFVDSFLVNKNSNVEDLLKKLPGIQVDKNGKITAQGQEVKKVLVDGEEFFGNDPTVATRNLKAENVEAIQVFDKKSDQASFTGIDDGEKNKTINLKLKEDAKKGYFGKASAGFGTQDRYEHDAMFNKFKNKQKISAYAATSNTNKTGLNWEDNQKYGSNDNTFVDDESGSVYTYYNSGGESFDGVGIPQTFYVGGVFADKFKVDTHSVNASIKYQDLNVSGYNNNYTKYILPDTLYYNNQLNNFSNAKQLASASGKYEWKIDSLTTIKIDGSVKQLRTQNNSDYTTENLNGNGFKVNENKRTQTSNNIDNTYNVGFYLGRKFKTKGRSLSIDLDETYFNGQSQGFLVSGTNFYEGNGTLTSQNINQKKTSSNQVNTFLTTITYTEPLSSKWFVVADASSKININNSDRTAYEKDNSGGYNKVVDSLSNALRYDILVTKGGLALKYNTKKIIYSIGGKASYTDLRQKDLESLIVQNQYFFNLFPSASFQYKIRSSASLSVNYNGRTSQPNLQQIQPIIDNSNPLDIYVGNPNLEQSFTNNFSLSYNNYKAVSGTSLYVSANYSFAQNDFVNYDLVDGYGRKIHQTVNVNGNKRANIYSYYWFDIKAIDGLSSNVNVSGSYSENNNFINTQANTNINNNASVSIGVYYNKEDKLELGANADWDYNRTKTSLRKDVVTQYWVSTYSVSAEYFIKKKYSIGSDCNFNLRQQTEAFAQNFNAVIWNAFVSKKFLKRDNLVIKVGCNDVLNQNIGFRRDATSNYVNENTYAVLKRYFMINLTWNFTKGGVGGE